MELGFKIFFMITFLIFCLVIIAAFLLFIKVMLIFFPEISLFGIVFSFDIPSSSFR